MIYKMKKKGNINSSQTKSKISELLSDKYDEPKLNNVATIRDLQALADAGIYFYGNDGMEVHKQLSNELRIKGDGTTQSESSNFKSAKGNINIRRKETQTGDNSEDSKQDLIVQLNKELSNMTSFETDNINHDNDNPIKDQIKLNAKGLTVINQESKDGVKKEAKYSADGITLKDNNGNKLIEITTESNPKINFGKKME